MVREAAKSLDLYHSKRDFKQTPEPAGRVRKAAGYSFVIQKHAARRLHYDFRLELDGVLKSWAVTRGPSLNPADKRLAVRTEDHPVDYGEFEGVIPSGYGAGTVMLWDQGKWQPKEDPHEGLQRGVLKFDLKGERLNGGYALVRMKGKKKEKRENWLLIKENDRFAEPETVATEQWTTSITSARDLEAIKQGKAAKATIKRKKKNRKTTSKSWPKFVPPQLAVLREEPPAGDEWVHELKFDGYRIQAILNDGQVRLMTRNAKDWTDRYPLIAQQLALLDVQSATIDGELVALDDNGKSVFGQLQNAADQPNTRLAYYAFDLLSCDGKSLLSQPLSQRKSRLEELLPAGHRILRYSEHIQGTGAEVVSQACAMKLEGIISKKLNARYRSGRTQTWIKTKCIGNDEFVVGGYRRSDKAGRAFSSLLLGEYVDGKLVYRGRVGTGFSDRTLEQLGAQLDSLRRKTSPFEATPGEAKSRAVWVTPRLVAQIAYTEVTDSGRLRQPRFLGLREDKEPQTVTSPVTSTVIAPDGSSKSSTSNSGKSSVTVGGVKLSSPDRVVYPEQGATKLAIAEYYLRHADSILPYLKDRPLSLVRCPKGRQDSCFFQRHHTDALSPDLKRIDIKEKDGKKEPYLYIDSARGLIAAAQIGVLELHLWGVRRDKLERPERLVFDLDPDEELDFSRVRQAAVELREVLEAAGLQSFALLTGGKGIHVVVPLLRRNSWEQAKEFSRGLAVQMARAAPDRYVATASKHRRSGKIFIDWLRNGRGDTAIAPYSMRARPGAPIATPLAWRELARVDSAAAYNLDNIDRRLASLKSDPWDGYQDLRQSITQAHIASVS